MEFTNLINVEDNIARFMGVSEDRIKYGDVPNYCSDLNLVYEVEEKLYKSFNGKYNYLSRLEKICKVNYIVADLIHASAIDRCKAILLVLNENNY